MERQFQVYDDIMNPYEEPKSQPIVPPASVGFRSCRNEVAIASGVCFLGSMFVPLLSLPFFGIKAFDANMMTIYGHVSGMLGAVYFAIAARQSTVRVCFFWSVAYSVIATLLFLLSQLTTESITASLHEILLFQVSSTVITLITVFFIRLVLPKGPATV